jgi:hypothetical protein
VAWKKIPVLNDIIESLDKPMLSLILDLLHGWTHFLIFSLSVVDESCC